MLSSAPPVQLAAVLLLSDWWLLCSPLQGNPVGQSGLGMAYLYGRGVQVVSRHDFNCLVFLTQTFGRRFRPPRLILQL